MRDPMGTFTSGTVTGSPSRRIRPASVVDSSKAWVSLHVESGHVSMGAAGRGHRGVLETAPSRRARTLLVAVPLGETEILDRVRERCQVTDTHPASVTCLSWASTRPPHRRDGRGTTARQEAGATTGRPTRAQPVHGLADDYDIAFLDCPPNVSLMSENVLRAADVLLVPLIPAPLSLHTYAQLTRFVADAPRPRPEVVAFFSMAGRRKRLHRRVLGDEAAARHRLAARGDR